ncbi:MAG TPA: glycosyltransferase family 4 protein [Terrimicrobiaceae bacterium]
MSGDWLSLHGGFARGNPTRTSKFDNLLSTVRSALRGALALPARLSHRRRLSGIRRSDRTTPVVSFGGVLEGRRLIHGGAVKLIHLRDACVWNERTFNLLYLVSSALPAFAEDLLDRCERLGIALVWNQNGVAYPGWAGKEANRYNDPMRRLRAKSKYVIYQSAFCRDSAELFLGHADAASEVIYNPVDLKKFRPAEDPLPAIPLRLLTLGTHGYPERVFSAVRCARVLIDAGISCSLTIAGRLGWAGGSADTRREIARVGLERAVTVLSSFTQDEAAELYRRHHILLHPKYLDPCPTVVIEALSCGLPVIGSASGGLPEMVAPSCGALIPAPLSWEKLMTPTGEELATAVESLLPRLKEAAIAARAHAEANFDGTKWVERHATIFRSVLE